MKKVYMIHGWGGSSEDSWFPWLKKELEKHNLEVEIFDMPDSGHPKIEEWVKYLEEYVKDVDEETYFIGHSIGCQTILRFLEKLHRDKRIAGCIFVAPWFNVVNLEPEEMEIAHPWINTQVDFNRIFDHCTNFTSLFSDDDPYVPQSEIHLFRDKLGSKISIEEKRGHFEEKEEPSILREALEFLHASHK